MVEFKGWLVDAAVLTGCQDGNVLLLEVRAARNGPGPVPIRDRQSPCSRFGSGPSASHVDGQMIASRSRGSRATPRSFPAFGGFYLGVYNRQVTIESGPAGLLGPAVV